MLARPNDAGSTTLELAILFPLLLLVVTALVQYGLWFHARSVALAAAQEGVTAARALGAAPDAGVERATAFVVDHGGETLVDLTVAPLPADAGTVGVRVSGRSLSLLPGVPGPAVTQTATGPIERFTTAGEP